MSRHRHTATGDNHQYTYQVRLWDIRVNQGKKRKTYSVRWIVEGKEQHRTFLTKPLAEGFRSKLLSYVHQGTPFDVASGMPEPLLREAAQRPWFEHACQYVEMKWPDAAPKSRTGIADALATVTLALLRTDRGRPSDADIRQALYGWAFVAPLRQGPPPGEIAATVRWLQRNTFPLAEFDHPSRGLALTRSALNRLATRLDGTAAAPTTTARKRAVFYNALEYAVELGLVIRNPIDRITWKAPRSTESIDRRVVVNQRQATALLAAVADQPGVAGRLVAFYACMYYAALRPSEALDLREENITSLPEEGGWGEFLLTNSSPRTGTAWTDTGRSRERRELKHRAKQETRSVPIHPKLGVILREHIKTYGFAFDGRLFVGPRGGTIGDSTYLEIWHKARIAALTPAEQRSPLAEVPYDLRHAAVSTWLNAGVGPQQVAAWAGHSVAVLLRVYAKCIAGQDSVAKQRIEDATETEEDRPST